MFYTEFSCVTVIQNVFSGIYASVFTLPLLHAVVLTMAIHEKKKKNYRKEGSDEPGVCALLPSPPGLTIASLFSLLPPNPYSLQCKQRLCHLHTCPAPGAARRETAHPRRSCTIQGLLPVLILSPQRNFTSLLCLQEFSELCSRHRKTTKLKATR